MLKLKRFIYYYMIIGTQQMRQSARRRQLIDEQEEQVIQHTMAESMNMYVGIDSAIEASRYSASDDLFQQVMDQIPTLPAEQRNTLLLICGLDDIVTNEVGSEVNLPRELLEHLQKAFDSANTPDEEIVSQAEALIESYDVSSILCSVYNRILPEIIEMTVREEDEKKRLQEAIQLEKEKKEEENNKNRLNKPKTADELRQLRIKAFEQRMEKEKTN